MDLKVAEGEPMRLATMGEPMVEFSATGRESYGLSFSGDAVNVAISASRLGFTSSIVSSVGDDYFGKALIEHLTREDVDSSCLVVDGNGFTGAYFITLLEHGDHVFTYYRAGSSASRFTVTEDALRLVESADIFHFSGITQAIGKNSRRSALKAARRAHRAGKTVSYDVNFRPRLWSREEAAAAFDEVAEYVDVLMVSSEDWMLLRGGSLPERKIAEKLRKDGFEKVIVKAGAKGSFGISGTKRYSQRSYPVEAVDATGAGDAYDAGFICGLLDGQEFGEAMRQGSLNAAIKCTKKGGIRGLPTMRQLQSFYRKWDK